MRLVSRRLAVSRAIEGKNINRYLEWMPRVCWVVDVPTIVRKVRIA